VKRLSLLSMSKRTVLVGLVVSLVLTGAGLGFVSDLQLFGDDPAPSGPDDSTPPEPTVTPPGDGTPADDDVTATPGQTDSTTDTPAPTATEGDTPTPTVTPNDADATPNDADATPTTTDEPSTGGAGPASGNDGGDLGADGRNPGNGNGNGNGNPGGGDGNDGDDDDDDASPPVDPDPSMTFSVGNPADVSSPDGQVDSLTGSVSGSLEWRGPVDDIVLVVQTQDADGQWQETRRVVVDPKGKSLSLSESLGPSLSLATESQLATFANPEDGTTIGRTGRVDVTAVLFRKDAEVGRIGATDDYAFDVTNERDLTLELVGGEGASDRFTASDVAPGATGAERYRLTTGWRDGGTVTLSFTNLTGAENGFAEPERAVDSDEESELPDALGLRVAVVDGESRAYLVGSDDEYVPASDLSDSTLGTFALGRDDAQVVVVEWMLPESVGNEAMTDDVRFDLEFVLEGGTD
jgi:hypothetical protein